MLGSDEMRAWYGPDHVRLAADRGAIGTLLISDDLFRYKTVYWTFVVVLLSIFTGRATLSPERDMFRWSKPFNTRVPK